MQREKLSPASWWLPEPVTRLHPQAFTFYYRLWCVSAALQISHFCSKTASLHRGSETRQTFPHFVLTYFHCCDWDSSFTHSPSADCGFSSKANVSLAAAAGTRALDSYFRLTKLSLPTPKMTARSASAETLSSTSGRAAVCLTVQTVHGLKLPTRFISVSGRRLSLRCPSHNLCFFNQISAPHL